MPLDLTTALSLITTTAAAPATVIAVVSRPKRGTSSALVVDRLLQIAVLVAAALAAMLGAPLF